MHSDEQKADVGILGALIASGVPWCVASISAGFARARENNAQAAQFESTRTIVIKPAPSPI
jgi:hypothetical protein